MATEAAAPQAAHLRRRPGRTPESPCADRFTDGVEVLKDGTELHLASFCLADAELRLDSLEGSDDPMFATLKAQYADVLGGSRQGMSPDRGVELELKTGDARMPRSRPLKRLSDTVRCRARGGARTTRRPARPESTAAGSSIRPRGTLRQSCSPASRTGRGASVTTIVASMLSHAAHTRSAVEPLPHIDALLDGTRGSRFFTKLDLASSYHQLQVRASDR